MKKEEKGHIKWIKLAAGTKFARCNVEIDKTLPLAASV